MSNRLNSGGSVTAFEESVAKSYLISADQAHALHPNYKSKHEENHQPAFHGGIIIKINHNQRYATTAITQSILRAIAEKADVKLQVTTYALAQGNRTSSIYVMICFAAIRG